MIPEQLEQARADLAALEAHTATLTANLNDQAERLGEVRRAARDGGATFEDVVSAQTRHEAARGMLEQHAQDVITARDRVRALEAAQDAASNLTEGRAAREAMRQAEARFTDLAARVEGEVSAALAELERLSQEHVQAAARLQAALLRAGQASPDATPARRAFLAQVDPELSEQFARERHPLSLARFPTLMEATGRDFG